MPESSARILKVIPQAAISGGLLEVVLDNFELLPGEYCHCLVNSRKVTPVAVSKNRCLLRLPRTEDSTAVLQLESSGKALTNTVIFKTGVCLAEGMHLVSNPCIDPVDGSIILTKSGSRGQEIPVTLFRLAKDGELSEISVDIMNPTGLAFDEKGTLYVSSRAKGHIYQIDRSGLDVLISAGLGIATGIAFNSEGDLFVGDRNGRIYVLSPPDWNSRIFARLEPSVAAYHLAFSPDGRLFVTAPGLASSDSVYSIDRSGAAGIFMSGFGRPQGIAFDTDGNLYLSASYQGRRGIFKISPDKRIEYLISGENIVGLCFTAEGDLIAATNDSVYKVSLGIKGTLV